MNSGRDYTQSVSRNERGGRTMENNNQLEAAADQIQKLVKSDLVTELRGANEAKVRLLIIDEVLGILGWQKHEYEPEQMTSTGGYTD